MLQKYMHLFAHIAQLPTGRGRWARYGPAGFLLRGGQAYGNPGPLRPIFQQPVLPWGQVPECAIITVWVGGIIGNMYGAAKSGTHQIIGIDGRGRSAGAGDCNGTGARLSAKCRHPQAPGV